jgi:3-methyladenine DNA glycosylase AlkD
MHYYEFFDEIRKHSDPTNAIKMAAYMQNHFPFLGINSPNRKLISKEFLKEKRIVKTIDWGFVYMSFEQLEREFHYIALDYLMLMRKKIQKPDIEHIERLIQTKSWWDTVDGLDQLAGNLVQKYNELKETHIKKWMKSENIWLVRVSINFQLEYKESTDENLLAEAIVSNFGSKEFFVNKAIGWSLRQYSKYNKDWVRNFVSINKSKLNKLSVREATKYF